MIQTLDIYSDFDERVERFLKNEMTSEEEGLFKSELDDDLEKLSRAKTIALLIKEITALRQKEEVAFLLKLKELSLDDYENIVENTNLTSFDDEVNRFLRNQMTKEEEIAFKLKVKADKQLESRAKLIALTIKEMKSINEKQDSLVIEHISNIDETKFREKVDLPRREDPISGTGSNENVKSRRPSNIISFVPFLRQHIAAACITGLFICGGGVGIMQLNAYNNTTAIYDTYYNQGPIRLEPSRANIDSVTIAQLNQLFANVEKASELENTITALKTAYEKSEDEKEELNYVRNEIAWNLSMAHLKTGNRKAAKPILKNIIDHSDPGRPIHETAKNTLDAINKITSIW